MIDEADRDLVSQAVSGSRPALERLLLAHYNKVVVHITHQMPSWLKRVVSAEDILQEAFGQAFRDIGHFAPSSERAFVAWLKSIAENRLQDTIKALKRKKRGGDRRQVSLAGDHDTGSLIDLLELLPTSDATPSRVLRRSENVQAIQVAVAGLPEDYRRVIQLRYQEGKSVAEISAEMQRSEKAIGALLHRAKDALRASLGRASNYLSSQ